MMKTLKDRPIGIFDSGVGGLTVVRSVHKHLPGEDIIYFGDTARVPYGNKSRETIIRFSKEIMEFMMKRGVKMVVVACNTASSLALSALKRHYPVPVIGVIEPGVAEAVRETENRRVGVIGTPSTIASGSYQRELAGHGRGYRLFPESCPLFVPLVENRFLSGPITEEVVRKYLAPLRKKKIDTLILGCTHYPLLKNVIGKAMKDVRLIDSSTAVARNVRDLLAKQGMTSGRRKGSGRTKYFVSDDTGSFRKVASIFLKEKINVRKVNL